MLVNHLILSPADVLIRPAEFRDIPAVTTINNTHFPDRPRSVESYEHEERSRDPKLPFRQLVAEHNGKIVAYGNCGLDGGPSAPDTYGISVMVAPELQGRGLGRRMLAELEAWARGAQIKFLDAGCREDSDHAVHFLQHAGFEQNGRRFESKLDLHRFDPAPFADVWNQIAAAGITLTTLAEETAPDAEQRLYELAYPLLKSVPFPGGAVFDVDFRTWRNMEIATPDADPRGFVIAKHGDECVGYSNLWMPRQGAAYTAMTGVHPAFRRCGVALTLKLRTIEIAREHGYHEMRTNNDTANPGILTLNQKLGYEPAPGWLSWNKRISEAQ